jgi:6-phosphofructokinase
MPPSEKQKEAPTQKSEAEVKMVPAPDFKIFYVNHIQASFTPFDISLVMSEALGAEEGKFLIQAKARVTISPVEAKILQMILANTIANFEKAIGPITIPIGMTPEEQIPVESQ